MSKESLKKQITERLCKLYEPHMPDELASFYDEWADKYDSELAELDYRAPEIASSTLSSFLTERGFGKDANILDVCSGTGRVGVLLKNEHGYTNVDGVDASKEMVAFAGRSGAYRNLMEAWIGELNSLPLEDDLYDAVVLSGAFAPCHLPFDAFYELIRIVKKGGLIVNVMRETNTRPGQSQEGIKAFCEKLEEEEKWKCIMYDIHTEYPYQGDIMGLKMVYTVG